MVSALRLSGGAGTFVTAAMECYAPPHTLKIHLFPWSRRRGLGVRVVRDEECQCWFRL